VPVEPCTWISVSCAPLSAIVDKGATVRLCLLIAKSIALLLLSNGLSAQSTSVRDGTLIDIQEAISRSSPLIKVAKGVDLFVRGEQHLSTTLVVVDNLKFEPDSKLIIDPGANNEIVLFAQNVSLPPGSQATITWKKPTLSVAQVHSGPARTGRSGVGHGARGESGENGVPGVTAAGGANAPRLTFIFGGISEGKLQIDLKGQAGGRGGDGQRGGDGGNGAKGSPASQDAFNCRRGAGPGGPGGNGGRGGDAGPGGHGGRGGTLIVAAPNVQTRLTRFEINVNGGEGGLPGTRGVGGDPGMGGPAGEPALPWCRPEPGRAGPFGRRGDSGNSPGDGSSGDPGQVVAVNFDPARLSN
jgi:hypothetical protein